MDDLCRANIEIRAPVDRVAPLRQAVGECLRPGLFDPDPLVVESPAWRVGGRLRILLAGEHAAYDLDVTLRLHRPAHNAKGGHGLAVLGDKAGNDRVEWPFSAGDLIRMSGRRYESDASIVHRDPRPSNDDTRAEPVVVRLDERDHHAVLIGSGKIHRAVVTGLARTGRSDAVEVDGHRELVQTRRVEKLFG